MVWIAAVIAAVGLLVPGGGNFGVAGSLAPLAGAPLAITWLGGLASPGQAVAIALALAACYGWLARRIWQGSTTALGLSLALLLVDLGGGVLVALGTTGEAPPGLVILGMAVFFGPRLGLIYLISQCLSQSRDSSTAGTIGALAQALVECLVDPIGWLFYRLGRSSPSAQAPAAKQSRDTPDAQPTLGRTGGEADRD